MAALAASIETRIAGDPFVRAPRMGRMVSRVACGPRLTRRLLFARDLKPARGDKPPSR